LGGDCLLLLSLLPHACFLVISMLQVLNFIHLLLVFSAVVVAVVVAIVVAAVVAVVVVVVVVAVVVAVVVVVVVRRAVVADSNSQ
jgi:hypothetical protein